jgi:hypothetical protein
MAKSGPGIIVSLDLARKHSGGDKAPYEKLRTLQKK